MKRFNVVVLVAAIVLFAGGIALAEKLKPVPDSPLPDASGTVSMTWQKVRYEYYDWWTGQWIRGYYLEGWANYSFKGMPPLTDYWLSGTTTTGEVFWLAGFMTDTDTVKGNGGIYYVFPEWGQEKPKFSYFELWSDSTPDPYYLGEPDQLVLSSQ